MSVKLPIRFASVAGIVFLSHSAYAADVLPGASLPEYVSKSIVSQQPTLAVVSPTIPVLAAQKSASEQLPPAAQKIKFKLNNIILEGNHVYSTAQLQGLYQQDLHKTITIGELFNIVQKITNYYRNNGYILSRAILAPQHVKDGVVHITIIEGSVDKVNVTGHPHGAENIVQRYGNQIKIQSPLALNPMEKYLILANEVPGTQVKAVLSPSHDKTGASDITLNTQNQPVTGYLSYDNYGTRYIGPQEMTAHLGLNSILLSGDSTQVTITKAPISTELSFADVNYSFPVGNNGIRWLVGETYAHTHPLFVLAPLNIKGLNKNYYTTMFFPVIRTTSKNLTLRTGFNYLDSSVTFFDSQPLYTDHVRSLDLGGTYNFADQFYGSNAINADLRQGLPIFGYTKDTNIATAQTSHPGGYAVYTKLDVTLSRIQMIKGPLSLYALFEGQYAWTPVLASEQFAFGGSQLGRGYDVAELTGDKGIAGTLELRYNIANNKLFKWDLYNGMQLYTFYDVGKVWNDNLIGGIPQIQSAASTGVGSRLFFTKYLTGNLMWTQTLTKQVAAEQLLGHGRSSRVFFSITALFA